MSREPAPLRDIAVFSVDRLAQRLRDRRARRVWRLFRARHAAVVALLDPSGHVLLMRRAERAGDRWSAHVSLPGGMAHAEDRSLEETARRETREEVGVDLSQARLLGELDETRATAHGGLHPLAIACFVYSGASRPETTLSAEVTRTFWFPLDRAARGELDDTLQWPVLGVRMRFRCWRYDGETVWGLTYGILSQLIRSAREKNSSSTRMF